MQLFCHIIGNRNLIPLRTHKRLALCKRTQHCWVHYMSLCISSVLCRGALLRCYVVMLLGIYLFSDGRSVPQQRWISFHSCSKNVGDTQVHYTVEFYGSYLLHNFLKAPLGALPRLSKNSQQSRANKCFFLLF